MNIVRSLMGGGLAAGILAGIAWSAQSTPPVNKMCPVQTDHKVDVEVTVVYKGKVIGLCCTDCQKKFNQNPGAFASRIKEDFGAPDMPEGAATAKEAIDGGKAGGYLVAVVFVDKSPKSEAFLKLFVDPGVNPEILNCAFGKVEFKKDSDEARKFKVTSAPTLLLIDPTKDPAVVVKSMTSSTPKGLLKELQDAKEKLGK